MMMEQMQKERDEILKGINKRHEDAFKEIEESLARINKPIEPINVSEETEVISDHEKDFAEIDAMLAELLA